MRKLLGIYLVGLAITVSWFASQNLHVNDSGEAMALVGFCVFWPLTWLWLGLSAAVLFMLGWRGGPLW